MRYFLVITLLSFYLQAADVCVDVEGIEKSEGSILASLFSEEMKEQFPQEKTSINKKLKAKKSGVSFCFKDVKSGTYAIALMHDKNSNDKMDTFFGIPKEPYGNSGAYSRLKPSFEESQFRVASEDITMSVKVH